MYFILFQGEFSKFGKIIDIRINTAKGKTGMKGPGGHQVPNFGFITFDDEHAVAKCLDSRVSFACILLLAEAESPVLCITGN